MDEAGTIEQHVQRPELLRQCRDLRFIGHIEMAGRDQRIGERGKLVLGDVGRQHTRPLGGKSQRRRPADALTGRRHESAFTCKPSHHDAKLPRAALRCKLTKRFGSPVDSSGTSPDRILPHQRTRISALTGCLAHVAWLSAGARARLT